MKTIGVTCGDPLGVGPEIILKTFTYFSREKDCIWNLYFPDDFFECDYLKPYLGDAVSQLISQKHIKHIPLSCKMPKANKPLAAANVAFESIKAATKAASDQSIQALITAPVAKQWMAKVSQGVFFDHTQYFSNHFECEVRMGFWSKRIKLVLDSVHIPLYTVSGQLNKKHLIKTANLAMKFAFMLGIQSPKIGIAGLNPHAGEQGLIGFEEKRIIRPAIEQLQANHNTVEFTGPIPADTLFHKAYHCELDMLVALYHDQGLAPLKMIAFDEAVNISLGLPFIRTSPDHGTAFDIAYQNKANHRSFLNACKLAKTLCHKKNI